MSKTRDITVTVNGEAFAAAVEPRLLLADFLRHTLGLTGTHVGCEHGVFGACTVLLDSDSVRSCLMFTVQADRRSVETVESLGRIGAMIVQADDPEIAVGRIIELVKTRIPKRFGLDPIRDIQVLCPMNRGGVGARSLNIELQAALNPAGDRKVERFGWIFAPGDKVMQIENDYDKEVYNGDIGYIDAVDPNAGEIAVSFDGRSVTYGFGELDMLVPAYAATIHKSQGSEYPAVIIAVLTQHYPMLQRNLLYTGVTRGKKLVVLVGQKKAVAIAVRNAFGRRRWSKLAEWLSGTAPKRG